MWYRWSYTTLPNQPQLVRCVVSVELYCTSHQLQWYGNTDKLLKILHTVVLGYKLHIPNLQLNQLTIYNKDSSCGLHINCQWWTLTCRPELNANWATYVYIRSFKMCMGTLYGNHYSCSSGQSKWILNFEDKLSERKYGYRAVCMQI